MRILLITSIAIMFLITVSCYQHTPPALREGKWRATLEVMDGRELPFTLSVNRSDNGYSMEIYNAGEILEVDDIQITSDSILIRMPVFEGYFKGTFSSDRIQGSFINESLERSVPFVATYGSYPRFKEDEPAMAEVTGTWEVVFSPDTRDAYPAKGVFTRQGDTVTGTFMTTTGDYRFLEGRVFGDSLKLSTFDGSHAYLFVAGLQDGLMRGTFYSGNHSRKLFSGRRNSNYELPDGDTLTFLKDGYERLLFKFPDSTGTLVSLQDPRYEDKVVLVQLMGTWCPNCLDETRFLANYLEEHHLEDLEVLALAFEYARTPQAAFRGLNRLRERVGVTYPILLAQYGSSSKERAGDKLPMLSGVLSYPTLIFIDRSGRVRNIHTGFNGPATGQKYEEFKREFDSLVNKLLSEQIDKL